MSKPLSPQTIWTGASIVLFLAVAGYCAYNFLNPTAVTAQVTPTQYNLAVVDEMQASPSPTKANVFEKASKLHDIPQSQGSSVKYVPSELGKTDLSHPE